MKKIILLFCLITTQVSVFYAQKKWFNKDFNLSTEGIAINGYDPVAYLVKNDAVKGNPSITTSFETAVYYFSTEENKKLFLTEPAKYIPQYGGWCALSMSEEGKKEAIDPEKFKIIEGKLYFYKDKNALKTWNKDEANAKVKADSQWDNIVNNKP